MINNKQFITACEYFNAQPKIAKSALLEIRECIYIVVPDSEELINYNIPAYTLVKGGNREQQIMLAGYRNHVGFYPHPTTIENYKHELSAFKIGKGSVQFQLDQPLPLELILKMIAYRKKLVCLLDKD